MKEVKINSKIMTEQQIKRAKLIVLKNIEVFDDNLSEGFSDNDEKKYEASFSFRGEQASSF